MNLTSWKMLLKSLFILTVTGLTVFAGEKNNVSTCSYTDTSGKTFDLSPLIASNGSYVWQEDAYTIKGYSVDSLISDDKNTYSFALQVCRNIPVKPHPSCNETGSVFMIFKNTCLSMGNAEVARFQPNPFGDGVFLAQYHGQVISHIARYSSHIYFVCNQNVTMQGPIFEHINSQLQQAHFKIFTKYAC